jgi:hypothetical protein
MASLTNIFNSIQQLSNDDQLFISGLIKTVKLPAGQNKKHGI